MSGTITVGGKTYKITLTEVPGSAAASEDEGMGAPGGMPRGGGKKTKAGGKTRKQSPYMRFANKMRAEIIKENPSLKSDIPALGKAIGAKWRALSDEQKKSY